MARPSTRAGPTDTSATTHTRDDTTSSESVHDAPESQIATAAMATKSRSRRPVRKVKQTTQTDAQIKAVQDLRARMLAQKTGAVETNDPGQTTTPARKSTGRQSVGRTRADSSSVKSADQIVADELRKAATLGDRPIITSSSPNAEQTVSPQHDSVKVAKPKVRSSLSALANFQRRKRQPSLLAMVQQSGLSNPRAQDHTTTVEANGQGDTSLVPVNDVALDTSTEDVLADFLPDNESTPVNILRPTNPRASLNSPTRTQVAKNTDDEDLYAYSPPPDRTSRKRKSDEMSGQDAPEIQVPQSPVFAASPSRVTRSVQRQETPPEVIPSTEPSEHSSRHNSPELPSRQITDPQSDTYADPVSSSPPPSTPDDLPRPAQTTTYKPGRRPGRTAAASTNLQTKPVVTSADLRALLPRRRTTRHDDSPRDDFDIPSSSGREDDSRLEAASKRRKAASRKPVAKAPTKARSKLTNGKTASRKNVKSKPHKPIVLDSSDKENEPASSPLSSLSGLPAFDSHRAPQTVIPSSPTQPSNDDQESTPRPAARKKSDDLKAAAEKFKEIDQWDLEFESAPSLGDRAGHGVRIKTAAGSHGRKGFKGRRTAEDVGRCSSGSEWR